MHAITPPNTGRKIEAMTTVSVHREDLNEETIMRWPLGNSCSVSASPCFFRSSAEPKRVLCVDQDWEATVARDFPEAEVITTDDTIPRPSPPLTNLHIEPPEEDDIGSFNIATGKGLLGKVENDENIIGNMFLNLVPGGWLEILEMSFRPRDDNSVWCEISAVLQKLEEFSGFPHTIEHQRWVPLMEKLGYENVELEERFQPMNHHLDMVLERVSPLLSLHGHIWNVTDDNMSWHVSQLRNRLATEANS